MQVVLYSLQIFFLEYHAVLVYVLTRRSYQVLVRNMNRYLYSTATPNFASSLPLSPLSSQQTKPNKRNLRLPFSAKRQTT